MQRKIHMEAELTRIWNKVLAGDNFALIRNGDGEKGLILGVPFQAQEGWRSENKVTKLGEALKDSICIDDPSYIVGVSCPCCDPRAYNWYLENVPGNNITFANLWVNSNYQRFIADFSQLQRDAVVIANHRAQGKPIGKLNILDYYCVSDDCVSFWEQEADAMLEQILQKYGKRNGLLYVVSAGPMSGPIIARLFRANPNNCYLDFGSAIDSFYWGKVTRPYMEKGAFYAMRTCWMFEPNQKRTRLVATSRRLIRQRVRLRKRNKRKAEFRQLVRTLPQRCLRTVLGDKAVEKIKGKLRK